MPEQLLVKRVRPYATLPTRNKRPDAGWDLYNYVPTFINAGQTATLGTGIAVYIPEGYVGFIKPRSSMGMVGIDVHGGVVDSGYTGELKVCLHNNGPERYAAGNDERIAQLVILPIADFNSVLEVEELPNTERGDQGFGSSGK